jgi:hypothetical protein
MAKQAPERRHVVKIKIGADTWDHVLWALRDIRHELSRKQPGPVDIATGGVDFGYSVQAEEHPAMTHEKYLKLLHEYLEDDSEEKRSD